MTDPESDDARSLAEAAAWRVHLTEIDADTTEEFEAWLAADPRHRRAWARVEASWDFVGAHATDERLLEARSAALRPGPRFGGEAAPRTIPLRSLMATALLVIAGTIGTVVWLRQPVTYQTAFGERRVLTLSDGSRLTLDSDSQVEVSYRASERDLRLVRGQAQFEVAHNPGRPFRVAAASATVVASGTDFDIDLPGEGVVVTLIEGRVGVTEARNRLTLEPGQQATLEPGRPPSVAAVDVETALSWQSGQAVFHNATLAAVIAHMNRYDQTKFALVDADLGSLRVSGTFKTGNAVAFADILTRFLKIRADYSRPGLILLSR